MEEAPILTICSCQSQICCQLESLKRVFVRETCVDTFVLTWNKLLPLPFAAVKLRLPVSFEAQSFPDRNSFDTAAK